MSRLFRALIGLVFISALLISCSSVRGTEEQTKGRLLEYVDGIRVVNTHEHQWNPPPEFKGQKHNFYSLLAYSYLKSDLVSAGAEPLKTEHINNGDLEALWNQYGRYLDYSRSTTYYSHFLKGFELLYGYREKSFSKEGIQQLSEQIASNYARLDSWYEEAFQKAGFEVMFVDQYWNSFNVELDDRYFALVFNINRLVTAASEKSTLSRNLENRLSVVRLARDEGIKLDSLENYLRFAESQLKRFVKNNAVCLKNSMAYSRSLDYEDVPYEVADTLYARPSESLSTDERKKIQDFMFHWILRKAPEYELPIQIHTGYLAGWGNRLENGRVTKLNDLFLKYPDVQFVLFHGSFPWMGEYGAYGKMFPNVFLDLVWLPQLSREAAVRSLDEMLDQVPYNKFFWGGDCHQIEESAGSLAFAKDVVAEVLAKRIERGLLTEEVAQKIALHIFRENALKFFRLNEKLGMD